MGLERFEQFELRSGSLQISRKHPSGKESSTAQLPAAAIPLPKFV
jgi:hypothetical protein